MNSSGFQNISTGDSTRPPEIFRFVPGVIPTPQIATDSTTAKQSFNGSGTFMDEEVDIGFNDLQTLFLACFATLIPLLVIVVTGVTVRRLWRKYTRRKACKLYDGVLHTEASVDSVSQPLHTHLLNSDKQSAETHLTIETDEVCEAAATTNSLQSSRTSNHSNANGSIITMTLKNNHLIVETEERNDIEEDSRTTKVNYSPSTTDGVFVVEVQQGVRRSPGSTSGTIVADVEQNSCDQRALIHDPPNRFSNNEFESDSQIERPQTISPVNKEKLEEQATIRSGLTQSDQSLTNFSYSYGNQSEYGNGPHGYFTSDGCAMQMSTCRVRPNYTKPKITSAIFKSGESMKSFDILQDDVLYSDIMLRAKKSPRDDDDSIQEEQNRLGNSGRKIIFGAEKDAEGKKTIGDDVHS